MQATSTSWHFSDDEGTFQLENPHLNSYLYFPLVNEAGLMSAITPTLNGDIKTGQNAFLTTPVSMEDLHNNRSTRNFWIQVADFAPWSVTGQSAAQLAQQGAEDNPEEVTLEAGFLWHRLIRSNRAIGVRAEVTNFVPATQDPVELMMVTLTNLTDQPLQLTATAAIPIYGRSADDLRDHRHVTSLLHRIHCGDYGVFVRPTLSFDERGHLPNTLTYAVLGSGEQGEKPIGFFPLIEEFIGEGGTLDWPTALVAKLPPSFQAGQTDAGYEALGGLRFEDITLQPGESSAFILILAILEEGADPNRLVTTYGSESLFTAHLEKTRQVWKNRLDTFGIQTRQARFDLWTRWVSLQPTLRRLYGNSFLPAHDYGRGGRGWRDLWQDILALLLMESGDVSELLFSNFAGVRLDGSNATIIGSAPGEFKADRNNIPRVWMDHGAWPLLTTSLYIHQTGDLSFLLRQQSYFKDHLIFRSQQVDQEWQPGQGTQQQTGSGTTYYGSILEHILIQHLVPFFNVGEHNLIRLEGADWNDGMDMAVERGESVAFSALYAGNLQTLGRLILAIKRLGVEQVELAAELRPLLDTLAHPVNYNSAQEKRACLERYYESCRHTVSGEKFQLALADLVKDLKVKSDWLTEHIRLNEWIHDRAGFSWFNGYYDNDGQRVEGDHPKGVRMTLTAQTFALMGGIATGEQAREIVKAADQYLFEPAVGGYRLNTDFGEVMLNLGRAFGFAYGHKENGAMFSHMAVMYANALYQHGLVKEGYQVMQGIYQHCQDFPISRMYPGIPEYINAKGRGMYTWLTGSASWYVLTLITETFGVRGYYGDLQLAPKLVSDQFDDQGYASLTTLFAGKPVTIRYYNPQQLDYGQYQISAITMDGKDFPLSQRDSQALIPREMFSAGQPASTIIEVALSSSTQR